MVGKSGCFLTLCCCCRCGDWVCIVIGECVCAGSEQNIKSKIVSSVVFSRICLSEKGSL